VATRRLHRCRSPAPALQPARNNGAPITIAIETRTGTIGARVWQLSVGRNTLLLLDSNVEGNRPEDRELTSRLYGGDERVRIRQELLLGIGGVRALAAMNIAPGVLHLNEGHSAFAALELVRQRMMTEGVDAWEAIRRVSPQVVFTTHTPVPAGHDCFLRVSSTSISDRFASRWRFRTTRSWIWVASTPPTITSRSA
jgi:starch phosphorylase